MIGGVLQLSNNRDCSFFFSSLTTDEKQAQKIETTTNDEKTKGFTHLHNPNGLSCNAHKQMGHATLASLELPAMVQFVGC